jgi:hypothetical protein
MTTAHPERASRVVAESDDDFAATVAEDLSDGDDPEALPGGVPADERPLQSLPTIGHVGRYALKYQIGGGGLGTVYAALDPLLSRPIAVKTLHVGATAEQREALESQLLAEARAAAGLNHPHIVTVYDAGLSEQGVYIAMERLQGRDLRQLLADGWRPEPEQAVRIAKRVADALAYAHSRGVIHCDIKPANIFMIGRTQPKVLDFGIARVAQQQGQSEPPVDIPAGLSVPPPELGSPYYVAPEQSRGQPVDLRCDVYGVGVVLYELLTGRRAFEGHSLEAIRRAVLEAEVPPVHLVNRDVDQALSRIVARAMARDPAQRYRSARQLMRALRNWLEEDGSQRAAAPLAGSSWPWAALAGVGLAAAGVFWVLGSGALSLGTEAPPPASAATAGSAAPAVAAAVPAEATPAAATAAVGDAAPLATAAPAKPVAVTANNAARARERRPARDAAAAPAAIAAAAPTTGVVNLAVSPWGQVEVDGVVSGTTPPLSRLSLPAGTHRIVIRNEDFPPFAATVTVDEDKPVTLRHRFGT